MRYSPLVALLLVAVPLQAQHVTILDYTEEDSWSEVLAIVVADTLEYALSGASVGYDTEFAASQDGVVIRVSGADVEDEDYYYGSVASFAIWQRLGGQETLVDQGNFVFAPSDDDEYLQDYSWEIAGILAESIRELEHVVR